MSMLAKGLVALASVVLAAQASAGPVTANFDDVDTSGGDMPINSPYLGFAWSNFTAYTTTPGFDGFNNGIVSPGNAAYSGGEVFANGVTPVVGSVTSGTLFSFVSADLGAGYYDGLSLTVQGYRSGAQLFEQKVLLGTTGSQHFDFGFADIDTLTFFAEAVSGTTDPFGCGMFNCTQFTLDDVMLIATDVVTPPNGIPEPDSLTLAWIAGIGLAGTRTIWRRRGREKSKPSHGAIAFSVPSRSMQ